MEPTMAMQSGFIDGLRRAYQAPLVHYLTEMLGDPEFARKLAQDSFEKVQKLCRPDQLSFPRATLFGIATTFALAQLRRRRIERVAEAADTENEELPDQDALPADPQVTAGQIGQQLATAIKELRPSLRRVFVMAHVQGKARQEIAAALGVSEKRVGKRMTRALRLCRERLASQGVHLIDIDRARDPSELEGERVVALR
jgi:RNA polymerase sigma-70 factor (ECF subfamily)